MQSLNPQFDLLSQLIAAGETRNKVISHNIANVNTPNYQRLDVEFERLLSRELQAGESATSANVKPTIVNTPGLPNRADGNNVDVDREIGQLNKNAMLQQMYLQLLTTEMNQMRLAIDGT